MFESPIQARAEHGFHATCKVGLCFFQGIKKSIPHQIAITPKTTKPFNEAIFGFVSNEAIFGFISNEAI